MRDSFVPRTLPRQGASTDPEIIPGSILILGGTAEARALAAAATSARLPIVSSLAGRVSRPALPPGAVRVGGFGGADGLADYLRGRRVRAVVDATHPFAATMSSSASAACTAVGIPLLRLARPGWSGRPDAAGWSWVDSRSAACSAAMEVGRRAFLTTGRQSLGSFAPMTERYALVRVVEPAAEPLPAQWELLLDRGPYELAGEVDLMTAHAIDVLVTKDSGGSYTAPKLEAAAGLGIPVVVIRRPDAVTGVPTVESTSHAIDWLLALD